MIICGKETRDEPGPFIEVANSDECVREQTIEWQLQSQKQTRHCYENNAENRKRSYIQDGQWVTLYELTRSCLAAAGHDTVARNDWHQEPSKVP